jgi:hypothetical protein
MTPIVTVLIVSYPEGACRMADDECNLFSAAFRYPFVSNPTQHARHIEQLIPSIALNFEVMFWSHFILRFNWSHLSGNHTFSTHGEDRSHSIYSPQIQLGMKTVQ